MSLPCRSGERMRRVALLAAAFLLTLASPSAAASLDRLRVCSDPNNLPFSNEKREGFENRIAELLARDLGVSLAYSWSPLRRALVRNTLGTGLCDVLIGVPAGFERVATTAPYYRSSYVLVMPAGLARPIASLDDPALRSLRIGVQLVGDDGANSPPVHALSRRGMVDTLRGYSIYGDYAKPAPAADIIKAVTRGDVDVAVVWGPIAGYFAKAEAPPLRLTAVTDGGALPMAFSIAVGVRRTEGELRDRLDQALGRNRAEIEAILASYGVPLLPAAASPDPG
jgi:mxaJ protein